MPVNTLTHVAVALKTPVASPLTFLTGTFPASDTYPGSDVYPGQGSSIGAIALTRNTLTGSAI